MGEGLPEELRIQIFKNSNVINKLSGSLPSFHFFRETKDSDSELKCLGFKLDNFVLTGTKSQLSQLIIFRVTTKPFVQSALPLLKANRKPSHVIMTAPETSPLLAFVISSLSGG